jgi:hypothetical protein
MSQNVAEEDCPICPRCEYRHPEMTFRKMTIPIDGWQFFGRCPRTQAPVLMIAATRTDFDLEKDVAIQKGMRLK